MGKLQKPVHLTTCFWTVSWGEGRKDHVNQGFRLWQDARLKACIQRPNPIALEQYPTGLCWVNIKKEVLDWLLTPVNHPCTTEAYDDWGLEGGGETGLWSTVDTGGMTDAINQVRRGFGVHKSGPGFNSSPRFNLVFGSRIILFVLSHTDFQGHKEQSIQTLVRRQQASHRKPQSIS